jgi:hypothetical protein
LTVTETPVPTEIEKDLQRIETEDLHGHAASTAQVRAQSPA